MLNRYSPAICLAGLVLASAGAVRASLVASYSFEGNVNDATGNHNGIVDGNAIYTTNTPVGGPSGKAFSFDGSTAINIGTVDSLSLIDHSFTIDMFVSSTTTGNYTMFGSDGNGLHLVQRDDHPFMGFYGNDTGGSSNLAANTFYNVAYVYDKATGTQSIYVNGALDVSSPNHASFGVTGATAFIGQSCCEGHMVGLLDELKIFDTPLSQSEIAALVPEPSAIALVSLAGAAFVTRRRRHR